MTLVATAARLGVAPLRFPLYSSAIPEVWGTMCLYEQRLPIDRLYKVCLVQVRARRLRDEDESGLVLDPTVRSKSRAHPSPNGAHPVPLPLSALGTCYFCLLAASRNHGSGYGTSVHLGLGMSYTANMIVWCRNRALVRKHISPLLMGTKFCGQKSKSARQTRSNAKGGRKLTTGGKSRVQNGLEINVAPPFEVRVRRIFGSH